MASDISFSVGACARYQATPKESHLKAAKRIIQICPWDIGFWPLVLHMIPHRDCWIFDADWAGDVEDRKSTSGGCFYISNSLVSWHSKKQNSISFVNSQKLNTL